MTRRAELLGIASATAMCSSVVPGIMFHYDQNLMSNKIGSQHIFVATTAMN